jgi:hypothetical protein
LRPWRLEAHIMILKDIGMMGMWNRGGADPMPMPGL